MLGLEEDFMRCRLMMFIISVFPVTNTHNTYTYNECVHTYVRVHTWLQHVSLSLYLLFSLCLSFSLFLCVCVYVVQWIFHISNVQSLRTLRYRRHSSSHRRLNTQVVMAKAKFCYLNLFAINLIRLIKVFVGRERVIFFDLCLKLHPISYARARDTRPIKISRVRGAAGC